MGTIFRRGINYSGGGGDIIQVSQLPVASADELGNIYQYVGATDTNYTKGYFYECVEVTPATDPKTYEWKQKNVQDGGSGTGNASFELDKTNNIANISNQAQHLAFSFGDDEIEMTAADPGTYYKSKTIPTKGYTDSVTGDLTNLTTTEKTNLVGAVNEVNGKLGINFAVGKETWYGTYTDENNVTYQVYTKTIYIPALPATSGITQYPHGVANIKQILSIYGFTTDGFVLNAPRQVTSDNIAIYQASKSASNQTFSIEVGKDRSSKSAYVTMVYAKNN